MADFDQETGKFEIIAREELGSLEHVVSQSWPHPLVIPAFGRHRPPDAMPAKELQALARLGHAEVQKVLAGAHSKW